MKDSGKNLRGWMLCVSERNAAASIILKLELLHSHQNIWCLRNARTEGRSFLFPLL